MTRTPGRRRTTRTGRRPRASAASSPATSRSRTSRSQSLGTTTPGPRDAVTASPIGAPFATDPPWITRIADPRHSSRAGADRRPEAGQDHHRAEHRVDEQAGRGLGAPPVGQVGRPPHRPPPTTQSGQHEHDRRARARRRISVTASGEHRRDREDRREHRRRTTRRRSATPLPPRNPFHTGQQCPAIAAVPAAYAAGVADRQPDEPGDHALGRVEDDHEQRPTSCPSTRIGVEPPGLPLPDCADVDRAARRQPRHEVGRRERPDHVPDDDAERAPLRTSDTPGDYDRVRCGVTARPSRLPTPERCGVSRRRRPAGLALPAPIHGIIDAQPLPDLFDRVLGRLPAQRVEHRAGRPGSRGSTPARTCRSGSRRGSCCISARVSSVMMRGPRVMSPYSAVSEIE